jgi:hypothetical protein
MVSFLASRPSAMLLAILANGVLCGLAWRSLGCDLPLIIPLVGGCALFMMIAGLAESIAEREVGGAAVTGFCCIVYSVIATLIEPFLWPSTWPAIVCVTLVLAPLLGAFLYLIRCQAWVSAAGVGLFVSVATSVFVNNARYICRCGQMFGL